MIAIIVGMAGVAWEFWTQRPAERDLRNIELHATVASLSAQPRTEATSYAVRKILGLMHQRGADMTGIAFPEVSFRMAEVNLGDRRGEFDNVNWTDAHMNGVEFSCSERIQELLSGIDHPVFRAFSTITRPSGPTRLPCIHLRHGQFDGASLQDIRFSQTDLSYASFTNARLTGLKAENVNFFSSRFVGEFKPASSFTIFHSPIFNCRSREARNSTDRGCVKIENSAFIKADLRHAHFLGASISRTNFEHANLMRAKFACSITSQKNDDTESSCKTKTSIGRVCFRHAQLDNATFSDVTITNSDFTDANLSKAKFERVKFVSVVFPETQEQMAHFDEISRNSLNSGRVTLNAMVEQSGRICE